METRSMSRRSFLTVAGTGALAAGAAGMLAGCAPAQSTGGSADEAPLAETGEWYGEAQPLESFDIAETRDVDILICGAGHAGLTAALAAAEQGATTLVIDKQPTFNTMREFWGCIGAKCQKDVGAEIDPNEVANELMRYACYRADQRVINLWARESGECVDWIMGHLEPEGFSIVCETDIGTGHHGIYPIWPVQCNVQVPGDVEPGPESFHVVPETVERLASGMGAEFLYETTLVQCVVEDGKVTGAIVKNGDGYLRVNAAKGVLISTGGYEGDMDLIKQLQPETYALQAQAGGLPSNVGEGIKAGIWAGGRKDASTSFMFFDRGAVMPDAEIGADNPQGEMFWMGSQPWLKVNLKGERFCNEDAPYDFPMHSTAEMKGRTWVSLYDSNWQDHVRAFHTQGCSRIDHSPTQGYTQIFEFPMIEGMNQQLIEKGYIVQADTIEELAAGLNLPTDALVATVSRYNELCAAGADEDFGKEAEHMLALDTPPFFGVRQGGMSYCTLDGLRINADCAVIDENDDAIEGLWAAGNVSGCFFSGNYPELIFGCACGRSMTQGRHAVLNMLGLK